MKIKLNKNQFITFYNTPEVSYEQFQEQLKEQGIDISIATIKKALKDVGLNPKNRKRGARITFEFEQEPEVSEVVDFENVDNGVLN